MKIEWNEFPRQAEIRYGKLMTFDIPMDPIPDRRMRTIRVWLPESYDGVKRYPVVYMHDAQNMFIGAGVEEPKWFIDRQMKELAADGIEAIVVGIDTSDDRGSELQPPFELNPEHPIPRRPGIPEYKPLGALYADFIGETLKPIIDENLMTLPDPANTCIAGASMGGLQSFYMIMRRPDIFGRAMIFSPAFFVHPDACIDKLLAEYDGSRIRDTRMYMFSGGQGVDFQIFECTIPMYRKMRDLFGLDYQHLCCVTDSRETHYMTTWGKFYPDAMRYLFSADNSLPQPPAHTQRAPEPQK